MVQYPREVTQRFHGTAEQMAAALVGEPPARWQSVVIEEYDPVWAQRFAAARAALAAALDGLVAGIEHVGSTSVPGLAAKPVIDIDLLLDDTADESRYVPALAGLGYRLVLREPWSWRRTRSSTRSTGGSSARPGQRDGPATPGDRGAGAVGVASPSDPSRSRNCARAWCIRDLTVPTGTCWSTAISP